MGVRQSIDCYTSIRGTVDMKPSRRRKDFSEPCPGAVGSREIQNRVRGTRGSGDLRGIAASPLGQGGRDGFMKAKSRMGGWCGKLEALEG